MEVGRVPVLVISGPVGVGKSTVAAEVSSLLSERPVAHTLVDLDVLAATFPAPDDDPYRSRLALRNLASLWSNAREVGSRNVILARVTEHTDELEGYHAAIPGAEIVVVRLRAAAGELLARVDRREVGMGNDWHRARALQLATQLDDGAPGDVVVDTTSRSVLDVAAEVVDTHRWETS